MFLDCRRVRGNKHNHPRCRGGRAISTNNIQRLVKTFLHIYNPIRRNKLLAANVPNRESGRERNIIYAVAVVRNNIYPTMYIVLEIRSKTLFKYG